MTKLRGVKKKMLRLRNGRKNSRVHAVEINSSNKVILPVLKVE